MKPLPQFQKICLTCPSKQRRDQEQISTKFHFCLHFQKIYQKFFTGSPWATPSDKKRPPWFLSLLRTAPARVGAASELPGSAASLGASPTPAGWEGFGQMLAEVPSCLHIHDIVNIGIACFWKYALFLQGDSRSWPDKHPCKHPDTTYLHKPHRHNFTQAADHGTTPGHWSRSRTPAPLPACSTTWTWQLLFLHLVPSYFKQKFA